jgi:hypothetical protein
MKSNQTVVYKLDSEANTITYRVAGIDQPIVLRLDQCSMENNARALVAGYSQVMVIDTAAIGRTDKDGAIIPEHVRNHMKWERMARKVEHLNSGATTVAPERAARAPRVESLADIRAAIGRATRRDAAGVEKLVQASVQDRGGDVEANLRYLVQARSVQMALAEMKAERAPEQVADIALSALLATVE